MAAGLGAPAASLMITRLAILGQDLSFHSPASPAVDSPLPRPYTAGMEVHLSPDIQAKLDRLASDTGRAKDDFVQDAMAGYFAELASVRETLDSRYDDLKSGKVKPIPGNEVEAHFAAKSAAHRSRRS